LPEFTRELRDLLAVGEEASSWKLAESVDTLRLIDRSRCGDSFCARFYTMPKLNGPFPLGSTTIMLDSADGMINVDISPDKVIMQVEVLYRDDILDELLPPPTKLCGGA
jgi:hypothetical protein